MVHVEFSSSGCSIAALAFAAGAMPGWVPGASSKNCGGPQYSLTKGLADGFTARVLIPQWQPYAAVELEFSEGWEFQIERVWGATRLPELGIGAYSQRKTFVLDATAPVVHGPEGYGCFGDEPEADDRQRGCGVFTFLARWGKFSGVAHAGHSAATPHPPGRVTCTPSAGLLRAGASSRPVSKCTSSSARTRRTHSTH